MGYVPRMMMEMSVAFLVFLLAVGTGLLLFQNGALLNTLAYVSGQVQDRSLHQTASPIASDGTISGAEVLHALARLEEGDVERIVDGVRYAAPLEREQLRVSGIHLQAKYVPQYERDESGRLLRLILRRVP
ncbi:hypothetical protein SK3146_05702 [Paenibacillus konkukensis]|uniref:TadE-like protein n=1 Tax=Paenibacillus konkukensis TaxID=2020716 RepID=A0ABY4RUV9_9BACL|nr:hypothetical protein [Paenibacillus konkukensis]UQZ86409.1 hypothetical protein SK3146_05702 [Paenibacillus konkukensis]